MKTDYGYHIIQENERQEAKDAQLEDHGDEIEQILLNERMEGY